MEKITIRADPLVSHKVKDSLYSLYMAIVVAMGGNPNNPYLHKEGEAYANRKFKELADEFEDTFSMKWEWVSK